MGTAILLAGCSHGSRWRAASGLASGWAGGSHMLAVLLAGQRVMRGWRLLAGLSGWISVWPARGWRAEVWRLASGVAKAASRRAVGADRRYAGAGLAELTGS